MLRCAGLLLTGLACFPPGVVAQSLSSASVTAAGGGQTATLGAWMQGYTTNGVAKTLSGTLTINLSATVLGSITGRVLAVQAADGANTGMLWDASAASPRAIFRRVNGTFASPTAIVANDVLGAVEGRGYDGTAYTISHAGIDLVAAQNWTTGARGGKINFRTTPNDATTTAGVKMTLENTGALLVATTTDNLVDKVQVAGGARANNLVTGAAALTLTTGSLGMSKMTASASAPGAAGGKVELVCGTNAGTAKLVAYAGTSGTAVTILDNIGGGVTGC